MRTLHFSGVSGITVAPSVKLKREVNLLHRPPAQSTVSIHICKLLEGLWVHKVGRRCNRMFRFLQLCPYKIMLTG